MTAASDIDRRPVYRRIIIALLSVLLILLVSAGCLAVTPGEESATAPASTSKAAIGAPAEKPATPPAPVKVGPYAFPDVQIHTVPPGGDTSLIDGQGFVPVLVNDWMPLGKRGKVELVGTAENRVKGVQISGKYNVTTTVTPGKAINVLGWYGLDPKTGRQWKWFGTNAKGVTLGGGIRYTYGNGSPLGTETVTYRACPVGKPARECIESTLTVDIREAKGLRNGRP